METREQKNHFQYKIHTSQKKIKQWKRKKSNRVFLKRTVLFALRFFFFISRKYKKRGQRKLRLQYTTRGIFPDVLKFDSGRIWEQDNKLQQEEAIVFKAQRGDYCHYMCYWEFNVSFDPVKQSCHSKAITISSVIAGEKVRILVNLFTGHYKPSNPCLCASVFIDTN